MTHRKLAFYVRSAACTALLKARGIQCSLVGCEGPLPVVYTRGKVSLGDRFGVMGHMLPCEFGAALRSSYLHVGNRVLINQGASVVAWCGIEIGDNTLIGDFVSIYDTNHHPVDSAHPTKSAPVVIGSNVWLARNVVVLPGSKIGDHTLVAAGSVVSGDLPPRVLAAGNPAKPVKELDTPDGWHRV